MGSTRKELIGKVAFWLVKRLGRRLQNKSPEQVRRIGNRWGKFIYHADQRRRNRTLDNLKLAFPDLSIQEREILAVKVYEHFGRTGTDFLAGGSRSLEQIESCTEIRGREHLERAIANGKGTLLISGHLGNWERMGAWISLAGYPLNVIARNADQEGVNHLVNSLREGPGTEVIPRGNSVRRILGKLKANEIVAILPDQNSSEAFIPFFGHPAGTVLGPGVIHARTGATILPAMCVELGGGKYMIEFFEELVPQAGFETRGEGLMRSINDWLESQIRRFPDQYLWLHDRWRTARRKGLI